MYLSLDDYRRRMLGCWIGKNVGGTLGMPMEWNRQKNEVDYYTHNMTGEPLPNDDLDIQVLWLLALEDKGLNVDCKDLGQYFNELMIFTHGEYGIAKANMRAGLQPPVAGWHNNDFKDSCGSFIRSEIWACLFPGHPELAAKYAFEDAVIDHGNGEGVYAEIFVAAMESACFFERDLHKLVEIGLSYIPADCAVALAVRDAMRCAAEATIPSRAARATWSLAKTARTSTPTRWRPALPWTAPSNCACWAWTARTASS